MMDFDLLLRGGRLVDPSQKLDAITDVAFTGGKVVAVGSDLKADPGTDVRNVSGYSVTPGLIDLHTHVYWGDTSLGIDAEEFRRTSGVTTAVDTGSAGPGILRACASTSSSRVKSGFWPTAGDDKVRSIVTPEDQESESAAELGAERLIRKL